MKIKVRNNCSDYNSYRAARVKSLFNAETGANFSLDADIEMDGDWTIGVVVGPSGSGKTSIGKQLFDGAGIYDSSGWPEDKPLIDAIVPDGDFDAVTGALSGVGLGSVPSWLRPYHVLSNGEKFRADLARIICDAPENVIIDEFTSVVDRQIAKFGAAAFQKAWRRTKGKCVLLSCHYDILEWVEPDWIFDTSTGEFSRRSLRRPKFDVEIFKTNSSYWKFFEPHYYLTLPKMVAAEYYVGTVNGELVAHMGVAPKLESGGVRASRMVIMPEFQGVGIGLRFIEAVLDEHVDGVGRYGNRVKKAYFHTSHPALCAAFRRSKRWRQVSANLHGGSKKKSRASMVKSGLAKGKSAKKIVKAGYGGHLRAAQGFAYYGKRADNV